MITLQNNRKSNEGLLSKAKEDGLKVFKYQILQSSEACKCFVS